MMRTTPLAADFDAPGRDTLKLATRWSPRVRFRYTRNTGRAQQRNTTAATGTSLVSLRTFPEPDYRSTFSKLLARTGVKSYRRKIFCSTLMQIKELFQSGYRARCAVVDAVAGLFTRRSALALYVRESLDFFARPFAAGPFMTLTCGMI
jgi:hypothetical protein